MDSFFRYDPQLAGSKGLVFIGDKLLVYRRDEKTDVFPLFIDLPGGLSEPSETPFETFKREVKEEFGLDIDPDQIIYVRSYESARHGGMTLYFPVVRLSSDVAKDVKFGNEGLEYFLMTSTEFLDRDDVWPEFRERALDYFAS